MAVLIDTLESPPALFATGEGVSAPLSLRICFGWGIGAVGAALMTNTFGVLLLRFMTDYLGIAAATAGLLVAISKIYDAVADPIIGALSDRTRSRMGRRRPYLLMGSILCPISLLFLFVVPPLQGVALVAYLLALLALFSTAYAVWSIPYLAMAAEMTGGYRERSRLISFRIYAGSTGQIIGAACGPFLLVYWGAGRAAHEKTALVLAMLTFATCFACFRLTRSAPRIERTDNPPPPLVAQLRLAWANRPFRLLILAKFLFFFGAATATASNAYFTKYVLRTSDLWLGTYYILLTVGTVASMPIWLRIGRGREKKYCMISAMLLFGVFNISWLLSGPDEPYAILSLRVVLVGFALGGFILFGQSMLPDTIEYDRRRTGMRREGAFTGVFILVEKAATAAGLAVVGLLLGAMGYIVSTANSVVEQPPNARLALYLAVGLIPAIGSFLAASVLLGYNLTEHQLKSTGFTHQ